jgi:hypothetical protein
MSSLVNNAVVFIPSYINVPENILKDSFVWEAKNGKLMTIRKKYIPILEDLMIKNNEDPGKLFMLK